MHRHLQIERPGSGTSGCYSITWPRCTTIRWRRVLRASSRTPPARSTTRFINLIARKLKREATVAIETPDPACLAIFASHFYIDPTHTRPVPAPLLRFYLEEAGLVNIELQTLAPATDTWPSLNTLPAAVAKNFFGGLDYAIFAKKP